MNIIEALTLAKEKKVKVRPKNSLTYVTYDHLTDKFMISVKLSDGEEFKTRFFVPERCLNIIFSEWEIANKKLTKEEQKAIESAKFKIMRYCHNIPYCSKETCSLHNMCYANGNKIVPTNMLDDWTLNEIYKAYDKLKKEGEI